MGRNEVTGMGTGSVTHHTAIQAVSPSTIRGMGSISVVGMAN